MAFPAVAVPKWVDAVKAQFAQHLTYAAVGYCFGVGAFGHPAFLNESHFKKCATAGPLFLSCAETDHTFPAPSRHRAEELLAAGKRTFLIQLFSGVAHGFALRGDMSDGWQRFTKEESASGMVRWFTQFM
ncbi:hypothetical protein C8R43DRAFT_1193304 [Mycena crocata]|nr:hypothetical protein C8R43DRAFT_1193304 [Mycena crocata]